MSSPAAKKPKKKKKFNANGATIKWLEAAGWTADIVEYRIPKTWITRDLFGCIDILAVHPEKKIIGGFQATADSVVRGKTCRSNGLARLRKLLTSEKAKLFVQSGGRLSLVVWSEQTDQHGDVTWQPTVSVVTLEDFE